KLAALTTYKKLHGNSLIPQKFVVPINDPSWPEETWNLRLGINVKSLRSYRDNLLPEHRNDLDKLGFVWDGLEYKWLRNLTALTTYNKLHGNLLIPIKFVVPINDPNWPEETWNLKIGAFVKRLRTRRDNLLPEHQHELDKLGFVWSQLEDEWQLKLAALTTYKKLHGNLLIPQKFVVPINDPNWPEETWNLRLGISVAYLRTRRDNLLPEHQHELDKLSFVWSQLEDDWQLKLAALTTYKKLHENLFVPNRFVVPSDDPKWPEETWNLKIGAFVKRLRARRDNLLSEHQHELDKLGFVWSQLEY
ncbi:hypothetical protein THRCLA_23213, partial [Thraustotheca clavata]